MASPDIFVKHKLVDVCYWSRTFGVEVFVACLTVDAVKVRARLYSSVATHVLYGRSLLFLC
jgi:hypothetical protein